MSLWGAVPLHPRERRTQGSVGGCCWASRGGTCGRWCAGGPLAVKKGSQLVRRSPRGVWDGVGEPGRLEPCLTAPTAVTPASAALLPLANRYPLRPPALHALPSDFPGVVEEDQAPLSCLGKLWLGKEVARGRSSLADSGPCGVCYTDVQGVKPSHPATKASLSKRYLLSAT